MTSQDRIIRSAIALFGERGYESTSLKDIGAHAGHAAGLITHHFKTKAALFLTCGLTVLDELREHLEAAMKGRENGLDAVLAFYRGFVAFALEKRAAYLVIVKLSPYSVSRPELTSEELTWKIGSMLGLLGNALERGCNEGVIAPLQRDGRPVDKQEYALAVFSMVMGAARTIAISPYAPQGLLETAEVFLRKALVSGISAN